MLVEWMNEWKKALVKPLFRALHFLDLMCLMGCEYRMELAGLLGVMGWEITVPLIRVGTLQAPSLFPPQPGPLSPPACVVVHTWSAAHSLGVCLQAGEHTRHPSDSPGCGGCLTLVTSQKPGGQRRHPCYVPDHHLGGLSVCVRHVLDTQGHAGNLWASSFLRLVQSEVPNTPRCQGMRGQVLQGEPGEGTHYHTHQ